MKFKSGTNIRKIRTLDDLKSEKLRLKGELLKTEEGIYANYHHIRDAFTFHNILKTVTDDITIASTAFSRVVSFGKTLFGKVKKKKKKPHAPDSEDSEQYDRQPDQQI
jgi:hypothetical protein